MPDTRKKRLFAHTRTDGLTAAAQRGWRTRPLDSSLPTAKKNVTAGLHATRSVRTNLLTSTAFHKYRDYLNETKGPPGHPLTLCRAAWPKSCHIFERWRSRENDKTPHQFGASATGLIGLRTGITTCSHGWRPRKTNRPYSVQRSQRAFRYLAYLARGRMDVVSRRVYA